MNFLIIVLLMSSYPASVVFFLACAGRQGLIYADKQLKDDRTSLHVHPEGTHSPFGAPNPWRHAHPRLLVYDIQKESTFHLVLHIPEGVSIFVRTLKTKTITLDVDAVWCSTCVEASRSCAYYGTQMVTCMAITFDLETSDMDNVKVNTQDKEDQQLKDARKIQKESTLHLVLHIRGSDSIFVRTLKSKTITLDVDAVWCSTCVRASRSCAYIVARILTSIAITSDVETSDMMDSAKARIQDKKESIPYLVLRLRGGVQIFVKNVAGKNVTLAVKASDMIDNVKGLSLSRL